MRIILPAAVFSLLALSSTWSVAADVTVQKGGKPAFTATLPAGWTAGTSEAKTVLRSPEKHPHVQVWATTATDVAAAVTDADTIVTSEVTHFIANKTEDLTVAGAPAKALIGTGEEADDGDPSLAETTFFTVGGTVYVLIAHGEGDGATKRRSELRAFLASIKPAH